MKMYEEMVQKLLNVKSVKYFLKREHVVLIEKQKKSPPLIPRAQNPASRLFGPPTPHFYSIDV